MTINHIGISGGKDSTALLLWAIHESGYDRASLDVTFCDTGNEHELTYAHVRMLGEKLHPITWLKPELDFYALAWKRKRFPSPKARFCTEHLKIFPTIKHVQVLLDAGHEVLMHSGVRADESEARSKLSEHDVDDKIACKVFRPLLRWTLKDVLAIHERHGIPLNPLYSYGARRVGCFPCMMSRKDEIRMIAKKFPERIDMIRTWERRFKAEHGRVSTFFKIGSIPDANCTEVYTREKDGKTFMVPNIDDVVRWSFTARGGKQMALDFDSMVCPSTAGACE